MEKNKIINDKIKYDKDLAKVKIGENAVRETLNIEELKAQLRVLHQKIKKWCADEIQTPDLDFIIEIKEDLGKLLEGK